MRLVAAAGEGYRPGPRVWEPRLPLRFASRRLERSWTRGPGPPSRAAAPRRRVRWRRGRGRRSGSGELSTLLRPICMFVRFASADILANWSYTMFKHVQAPAPWAPRARRRAAGNAAGGVKPISWFGGGTSARGCGSHNGYNAILTCDPKKNFPAVPAPVPGLHPHRGGKRGTPAGIRFSCPALGQLALGCVVFRALGAAGYHRPRPRRDLQAAPAVGERRPDGNLFLSRRPGDQAGGPGR